MKLSTKLIRKWEYEYGEDFWIDGPIESQDEIRIVKLAFQNISLEDDPSMQEYLQNNDISDIKYIKCLIDTFDSSFKIFRDDLQETKEFKYLVKHLIRAFNELGIDASVYFEEDE